MMRRRRRLFTFELLMDDAGAGAFVETHEHTPPSLGGPIAHILQDLEEVSAGGSRFDAKLDPEEGSRWHWSGADAFDIVGRPIPGLPSNGTCAMIERRFTLLIAAFAALAACAPPPGPLFLRAPASPSRDTGYVMFSLTETGLPSTVIRFCPTLYLRGVSNAINEKVAIIVTDALLPGSASSPKVRSTDTAVDPNVPKGKIVLVELPPGDYEFVGYLVTSVYLSGNVVRYVSASGFDYKFDVVPRTINYVGDLNFTPMKSLRTRFRTLDQGSAYAQPISGTGATTFNFVGSPHLGVRFQILDRQDRDAPLFDTEFPAYSQRNIILCDGCALRNP